MGLSSFVKGKIVGGVIEKIAKSEPRTTVAGAMLGGLVAANIDYGKLMQKDPQQIGMAVGAVIVALMGYYSNHSAIVAPTSTTPVIVPEGPNGKSSATAEGNIR